ncbi:Magnesium chelatase, subunit ChlI C-terminal [Nitrosospira briensis]|nr:Magnesium chelatase, subunit ChlI C-terminal [Nitrosospira briensis]
MNGVLFLDELPEFERKVLEVLREPLESERITISRAARQADFPARFQLVAAMNPCLCGYLGHHSGRCRCTPDQVTRYRGKISGPLLDRIDVQIEVPAVPEEDLMRQAQGESSSRIRQRVERAYQRQLERQGKANARLAVKNIDKYCVPDMLGENLLKQAISRLNFSARAYHRVLKVARTIADLAVSDGITSTHIAEAVIKQRELLKINSILLLEASNRFGGRIETWSLLRTDEKNGETIGFKDTWDPCNWDFTSGKPDPLEPQGNKQSPYKGPIEKHSVEEDGKAVEKLSQIEYFRAEFGPMRIETRNQPLLQALLEELKIREPVPGEEESLDDLVGLSRIDFRFLI